MEFKKVKLGEIAKFNQKSYKSNYNWKTVKYLDTGNLNKNKVENLTTFNLRKEKLPSRAKRIPQINSILYSTVRPNQEHYGILENKFDNLLVSTGFTVIDIYKENINPKYIYYFLTKKDITAYLQKIAEDSVSTYPAIKPSDIKNLEILLPNRNNQDKIEQILSNLDSKIEINNKIISNLESQAQAIFKSWFADFEPFQDGNFVESELGMIPEGWEVKKVNEICDLKIGRTPPRKESEWFSLKEGVKWVSIKDLGLSQMYISEVTEYLTEESIEKFNIPIVEENTLLLSFKLTVGRIAITTEKMCTNEAIAQFKDPLISTLFLFYYFKNFKFETLGNTSSIGNAVNSKIIKNIEVLVPPEKIVLKVMKMIEPLSICIRKLLNQNTKLAELRDALLPKLMAGEIDVSNIKIEGEEVKNE